MSFLGGPPANGDVSCWCSFKTHPKKGYQLKTGRPVPARILHSIRESAADPGMQASPMSCSRLSRANLDTQLCIAIRGSRFGEREARIFRGSPILGHAHLFHTQGLYANPSKGAIASRFRAAASRLLFTPWACDCGGNCLRTWEGHVAPQDLSPCGLRRGTK